MTVETGLTKKLVVLFFQSTTNLKIVLTSIGNSEDFNSRANLFREKARTKKKSLPCDSVSTRGKPGWGFGSGKYLVKIWTRSWDHQVVVLDRDGSRTAAPEASDPLQKLLLELFSEDDVDEDVDRRVEGHEEVRRLR